MKVLIVENINSRKINGGIPVYIKNVISANNDIDFTVLGTGDSKAWEYSNFLSLSKYRIGHVTYMIYALKFIIHNKLYKDFDVIHFQRYDIAVLAILFKIFSKVTVYTTLHGDHLNSLKSKKNKLRQYLYKILASVGRGLTDYVILVSKQFVYMVNKEQKYTIIPVGIDPSSYGFVSNNKIDPIKFIYVGRIDKEKGIILIIESFLKYRSSGELIIVGDGPLLNVLKKKYLYNKNIKFTGFISQGELHEFYNKSHCLLLASEFEASPTVVREALYFNLNIITLDIGDIQDLFYEINCIEIVSKDNFGYSIRSFEYQNSCFAKLQHNLIDCNILYQGYYSYTK